LPAALRSLGEALQAVRAFARSIGAWIDASRRAARDRDALARMSDRELSDIGIAGCAPSDRTRIHHYPF
jgi:uncharacterized protein YjiS (DUF1127 family)